MAPLIVTCLLAVAPTVASAQDMDAHGLVPAPSGSDPGLPVLVPAPERHDPGTGTLSVRAEVAGASLVRITEEDLGSPVRDPLVGGAVGATLTGRWALARRVAVGASIPTFAATFGEQGGGPALGDLHLWAPLGVVLPRSERAGFGVSVLPYLRLATGAQGRWLGDATSNAGLQALVGGRVGRFSASGSLGVEGVGWGDASGFPSGSAGRWSLAAGGLLTDDLGLHAELFGRSADPGPDAPPDAASPAELHATLRGSGNGRVGWVAGVGRAVTGGAGAASVRAWAGATWHLGASPEPDPVFEVVSLDVRVTGTDGAPIASAVVAQDGVVLGRTDADGALTVAEATLRPLEVQANGWLTATATPAADGSVTLTLGRPPVAVSVRATDRQGTPMAADLTVFGPDGAVVARGVPGSPIPLVPGTWSVEVAAEGMGTQARTVVVPVGNLAPIQVDVLLAPTHPDDAALELTVTDPEGRALRDVEVLIDGEPLGTTSTGGDLDVRGLLAGAHTVGLRADGFVDEAPRALSLQSGLAAPLGIVLAREPGAVRVRVVDPTGLPVDDATLRLIGPSRFPASAVGPSGEKDLQLRAGAWTLFVTSPKHGVQQRDLVIEESDASLVEVTVVLQPPEAGSASLALRVVDPTGAPVSGAEVLLDGQSYGTTSTGGTMVLAGLDSGVRALALRGPRHRPVDDLALELTDGAQEHVLTLGWLPGSVRFSARDSVAPVPDATLRLTGPLTVPPLPLGADGVALTTVDAGAWQASVTSPSRGLAGRAFTVTPDDDRLIEVDVLLTGGSGDADLDVRVRDPRGQLVDGAEVKLDGEAMGDTIDGLVSLRSLDAGTRTLEVTEPAYATAKRSVKLGSSLSTVDVALGWGVGAVEVSVTGPDGPVSDAVVRVAGASELPPLPVYPDGTRVLALSPGSWQVLVTSRSSGVAQQAVVVPDRAVLTPVAITLEPVGDGDVSLLVRVVDEDGKPIPGARVRVGGADATTTPAGATITPDLTPGPTTVEVAADGFQGWSGDVVLAEGTREQIVALSYVRSQVTVQARGPDGAPLDAEIRVEGPDEVAPATTGADGDAMLALRPGSWTVITTTADRGTGRATLTVPPGGAPAAIEVRSTGERRVETTGTTVVIKETVPFDFDRATLRPESGPILEEVANALLSRPDFVKVEVQGHSDRVGGVAYNYELSTRRAEAVVAALVALGVPPERMVARGYGATRPLVPEVDDATAAQNRRVAFEVVERSAP